jgi:hypothetical protein
VRLDRGELCNTWQVTSELAGKSGIDLQYASRDTRVQDDLYVHVNELISARIS